MARPAKVGLDYFPVDVDIFDNEKLFDVQNKYGPLGETIFMRLLCLIYKNGYYYQFEDIDRLSAMLVKSIGNRWVRDKQTVKQVILYLVECNLFSKELMQENVLTSAGIQRRYLKAAERRKSLNTQYLIVDENGNDLRSVPKNKEYCSNNGINVNINPDNESKNATKESKVKKSKINFITEEDAAVQKACETYQENISAFASRAVQDDIRFYLQKGMEVELIIAVIEQSARYNAQSWLYPKRILNKCLENGTRTAEQYRLQQKQFEERAGSSSKGTASSIDMTELEKFIAMGG